MAQNSRPDKIIRRVDVLQTAHVRLIPAGVGTHAELEGVIQYRDDSENADHDEHANQAPDHVLFAVLIRIPTRIISQTRYEHDQPPQEKEKSGGEYKQDRRVYDERYEAVNKFRCVIHDIAENNGLLRGKRFLACSQSVFGRELFIG